MNSSGKPNEAEKDSSAKQTSDRGKHRLSKPAAWVGGVITALVIAAATAFGTGLIQRLFAPPNVQISGVLVAGSCQGQYLDKTAEEAESSASYTGIPEGVGASVEITNQTPSNEAVVLTGLSIKVLTRGPAPVSGIVVAPEPDLCFGGGGGITPRPFRVDLETEPPLIVAEPLPGELGESLPPVSFPFSISQSDPEVFQLNLEDIPGDCTFVVQVAWVAAGQAGQTTLSNHGQGFRVIGSDSAVPHYLYGTNLHVLMPATTDARGR